ncbi:sodium:solute symporter family transporter [Escherichia coli]
MAGRLRVHTEYNNNALTLPDYFTWRFEDKSCIFAHYLRAGDFAVLHHLLRFGHVAGARLFESTFGMSYEMALWAGAAARIL